MLLAAAVCLLLTACAPNPPAQPVIAPAVTAPAATPTPTPATTPMLPAETPAPTPVPDPPRGKGQFAPGGAEGLSPAQAEVIVGFLTMYYEALARLETPDPAVYIQVTDGESVAAIAQLRAVWEATVEIRKLQTVDLSLLAYSFTLTCDKIEPQEDGGVHVYLLEDNVQRFAAHPDTDAEQFNVRHIVALSGTADAPLVEDYYRQDAIYWALLGRLYQAEEDAPAPDWDAFFETMRAEQAALLAEARENLARLTAPAPRETVAPYAHIYDRDAAIAYAREWVGKRNPEWFDYADYGGNCQNFASQTLLAGGVPMDTSGESVWKWFSDVPDQSAAASGRSSAWTGAEAFFTYADENGGKGLAAVADADFYTGEPGDLIALGLDEEIRHVVVITAVVRGADGQIVDYLVASNTTDQRDYPVSAYSYTRRRLIKIYGWN